MARDMITIQVADSLADKVVDGEYVDAAEAAREHLRCCNVGEIWQIAMTLLTREIQSRIGKR